MRDALPAKYQQFLVHGHTGRGDWPRQPFIDVMDPATKTPADGHYIVYLFSADLRQVHLFINEGSILPHLGLQNGRRGWLTYDTSSLPAEEELTADLADMMTRLERIAD